LIKDRDDAYAKGFAGAREMAAQKVTKDNAGAGCAVLRSEIRAMKPDPSGIAARTQIVARVPENAHFLP